MVNKVTNEGGGDKKNGFNRFRNHINRDYIHNLRIFFPIYVEWVARISSQCKYVGSNCKISTVIKEALGSFSFISPLCLFVDLPSIIIFTVLVNWYYQLLLNAREKYIFSDC